MTGWMQRLGSGQLAACCAREENTFTFDPQGAEAQVGEVVVIAEGKRVVVLDGEGPWQLAPGFLAIPTPGHTEGHCVLLYQERFLFTGDHLDWDRDARQLSASEDYCWYSWPQQAESMGRLAAYRFEWVLPGHGQRVHLPATETRQQIGRLAESMRERSQV